MRFFPLGLGERAAFAQAAREHEAEVVEADEQQAEGGQPQKVGWRQQRSAWQNLKDLEAVEDTDAHRRATGRDDGALAAGHERTEDDVKAIEHRERVVHTAGEHEQERQQREVAEDVNVELARRRRRFSSIAS